MFVVLTAAVVAGGSLRLASVDHKESSSHDEAISFVAATCHQDGFRHVTARQSYPYAVRAPAASWQRFWKIDRRWCFGSITHGLAHTDIHPPAYFWLLHVWSVATGVGLQQAVWLNILLATLTALATFGLGRQALGDAVDAGLLAAIWIVSSATISTSTEARQYDLFPLVTVLFLWQGLRVPRPERRVRPVDAALLGILTCVGALTHYLFGAVVIGAAALAAGRLLPREWRGFVGYGGAGGLGAALALALNPSFQQALRRERSQREDFDATQVGGRADRVFSTLADFFVGKAHNPPGAGRVVAALLVVGLVVLGILGLASRAGARGTLRDRLAGGSLALMALWLGGTIIALYLTFVSPRNGMGATYLAPVWPLIAAIPILLMRFTGPLRRPLGVILAAGVLAAGISSVRAVDRANADLPEPGALIGRHGEMLVDSDARGMLPVALWHAQRRRIVLVASQRTLVDHPDRWLATLGRRRLVYVSVAALGGNAAGRAHIRGALRREGRRLHQRGVLILWDPQHSVGTLGERVSAASRARHRPCRASAATRRTPRCLRPMSGRRVPHGRPAPQVLQGCAAVTPVAYEARGARSSRRPQAEPGKQSSGSAYYSRSADRRADRGRPGSRGRRRDGGG